MILNSEAGKLECAQGWVTDNAWEMELHPGHSPRPQDMNNPSHNSFQPSWELSANFCILGSFAFSVSLWTPRFACSSRCIMAGGQWPSHILIFSSCLSISCFLTWEVCAPMQEPHGALHTFRLASIWADPGYSNLWRRGSPYITLGMSYLPNYMDTSVRRA